MGNNSSPLESLAAFSIAFAAGVVATAALTSYVNWIKNKNDNQ